VCHVNCVTYLLEFTIWYVPKYRLVPYGSFSVFTRIKLATKSLSKDYFEILYHTKYVLTITVHRLAMVVCLSFEMIAFITLRDA